MELFLSIVFIVFPVAILATILISLSKSSPRDIFGNLLKFIKRAITENLVVALVQLAYIIFSAIFVKKDSKLKSKTRKVTQKTKKKNNKSLIHISPSEADSYVIINGVFPQQGVDKDIKESLSHFDEFKGISYKLDTKEELTIIELSSVNSLFFPAYLTQSLTRDYGSDNVFGYMEGQDLSLFFYHTPYEDEKVIGQTNHGETFAFLIELESMEQNFFIKEPHTIKPKLTTDFFKNLVHD